jgi:sRNA-binding carbon storage regulator CsrA
MLSLTMRIGQVLVIGPNTAIKIEHRSGGVVRLKIESDASPISIENEMPKREAKTKLSLVAIYPKGASWGLQGEMKHPDAEALATSP